MINEGAAMGVEARAGDTYTCGPSGDGEGAEECSASCVEGSTESQAAWGAGGRGWRAVLWVKLNRALPLLRSMGLECGRLGGAEGERAEAWGGAFCCSLGCPSQRCLRWATLGIGSESRLTTVREARLMTRAAAFATGRRLRARAVKWPAQRESRQTSKVNASGGRDLEQGGRGGARHRDGRALLTGAAA